MGPKSLLDRLSPYWVLVLSVLLAYTFSDTFWFSAVEGEGYASSSLFTAVVFWCILNWEDCADKPYANRWLVCIAYLMGLSVGVHLLNLLTIPVLVLVYYYRKYENPTTKGSPHRFGHLCVPFGGSALWRDSWFRHCRRVVRTVLCQRAQLLLQCRYSYLCRCTVGLSGMEHF